MYNKKGKIEISRTYHYIILLNAYTMNKTNSCLIESKLMEVKEMANSKWSVLTKLVLA